MSEGIDITDIQTRSYRFSGYRPKRDSNNNLLQPVPTFQPGSWRANGVSSSWGSQPYNSLRKK